MPTPQPVGRLSSTPPALSSDCPLPPSQRHPGCAPHKKPPSRPPAHLRELGIRPTPWYGVSRGFDCHLGLHREALAGQGGSWSCRTTGMTGILQEDEQPEARGPRRREVASRVVFGPLGKVEVACRQLLGRFGKGPFVVELELRRGFQPSRGPSAPPPTCRFAPSQRL